MFCKTCGAQIPDDVTKCSQCGNNPYDESAPEIKNVRPDFEFLHSKSRILAGLLQIFLCFLGAGRIYLGYYTIAVLQISVVFFTGGMGIMWPIFDGIMILSGRVLTDAKGNTLS